MKKLAAVIMIMMCAVCAHAGDQIVATVRAVNVTNVTVLVGAEFAEAVGKPYWTETNGTNVVEHRWNAFGSPATLSNTVDGADFYVTAFALPQLAHGTNDFTDPLFLQWLRDRCAIVPDVYIAQTNQPIGWLGNINAGVKLTPKD